MAGPSGGYPDSPTFKTLSTTGAATFSGTTFTPNLSSLGTITANWGNLFSRRMILRGGGDVDVDYTFNGSTGAGSIQVYAGGTSSSLGSTFYTLEINPRGGLVGIGTSTPRSTLDVGGTFRAQYQVLSAAPTVATLDVSSWTIVKNSTDNSVRLYVNDGGTIKSVALT